MTTTRIRRLASTLKSRASRFAKDATGNATMLVAFAMPMVIGGGGFAIDFAQFYLWKRELQYANDQAAIAAAWEMVESGSDFKMKERALYAFRTNEQITDSFNKEPEVSLTNYAGGVGNAVKVTSSATKRLPFTSFFTKGATTVSVQSQAAFSGGATYSSCLVAVEKTDGGAVIIGGNAVFTAECGIMAMSSSKKECTSYDEDGVCNGWTGEDAIDDNGTSYEIKAGSIVTAGTISDTLEEKAKEAGDTVVEGQSGLSDPYAEAEIPDYSDVPAGQYYCKSTGKKTEEAIAALNEGKDPSDDDYIRVGVAYPGMYDGGLTISCDTTFKPGVYYIKGGTLTINGNYTVTTDTTTGMGMMFVMLDGSDFKINGGADINLTGMNYEQLLDLYDGDTEMAELLTRMLIFEDPNGEENNGNVLNGNSATYLNGAIYTPLNRLDLSGTADVSNACLLLVANKVRLTGTLKMESWCPPEDSTVTTVIFGTVKLVV